MSGLDLWIVGLALVGISSVLGAINLITTIFGLRAPGMGMFRMPIFTWNILVTSVLILLAFPPLTAAFAMLFIDRHLGGVVFDAARGGDAILWQHIFWFFGHPEVYILILPFFGVITEIISVFSRKPVFGYAAFVLATVAIASLSMAVWAHHMFTTGAVDLPFFALMSFAIAVPTGIKFFNWIGTMWGGHLTFPTPMLWAMGFLYLFLIGGITGIILASPALDFNVQDTYFVVAHFHNTLIGGTVFAIFAATYYWFPKMTGRLLSERLGRLHFWLWIIGFTLTFVPQYQLGLQGMPRRIADYDPANGWSELNAASTMGSLILALGLIPFLVAVWQALRRPADAPDDPWGGYTLEWATTSPPPPHNFTSLPRIRSNRPLFDARQAASASAAGRRRSVGPMRHPSDEAVLFGRLAIFGLVVGVVYWFLTYETAGTVLLIGFGVASTLATISLWTAPPRSALQAGLADGDQPAGGTDERIPAPAFAPLIVGAGVAISALGLALGPLILPIGIVVGAIGGRYWLEAAIAEAEAGGDRLEGRGE